MNQIYKNRQFIPILVKNLNIHELINYTQNKIKTERNKVKFIFGL